MWLKQIIHLAESCVSLTRNSFEVVYLSDEHGLSIELELLSAWWLGSKKKKRVEHAAAAAAKSPVMSSLLNLGKVPEHYIFCPLKN